MLGRTSTMGIQSLPTPEKACNGNVYGNPYCFVVKRLRLDVDEMRIMTAQNSLNYMNSNSVCVCGGV